MNKLYIVGAGILLLIVILIVLVNIVGVSDNGRNLSTHFCDIQNGYTVNLQSIQGASGESCNYSKRPVNTGFIFFNSTGNSAAPYSELNPTSEVVLSEDCTFFENPALVLVLDSSNQLYACINA